MGEGRDFLLDEDTSKDTMLIKQASFNIRRKATSQDLTRKMFSNRGR